MGRESDLHEETMNLPLVHYQMIPQQGCVWPTPGAGTSCGSPLGVLGSKDLSHYPLHSQAG